MEAIQDKRALVTGGNRGIGFAIAQGLLAKDYEVIITSRSLDRATQAAQQLQGKVIPIELDVTNDRSINEAVKTLYQKSDRLDVLINNAGVYPDNNVNIITINRELLDSTMNANTFGPIRMVQAFLPLLEKSPNARVINVSSGYGVLSDLSADVPSYCLSKLALNGATIMLAQALQSKGIVVNSICPGWVRTDMGGSSAPRSPEQGADTAIWLATDAPRNITGKFLRDRQIISF
ncbi:MAG: SDR family NAD(P)-dependent oxidoreductase [Nostoc sp. ZfuVER08]|jgi:NAD(P)-dependent dehydrogenase (short-subunit alcohol dehydrogenase family)|uniref:SDR family NAD(P)-dependent oxidoreductase n=1 Tax=Nostoc punctiforme FACHB-252 TaxID=1357509 RepID=A0ABR8H2U6_NOSPU|nr:SDR family NAD(P)-dependent oxidoreductase [Nostoc punctiforme]MBD2609904.1 SDR family NAD(P)-dependent oxidoreductase [Nostoc punctiforme FACHB-252]MDZ8011449.1 SDR family NAD(P)-dependent oxidoreductase [Nostoc sp. ZfuVER08]